MKMDERDDDDDVDEDGGGGNGWLCAVSISVNHGAKQSNSFAISFSLIAPIHWGHWVRSDCGGHACFISTGPSWNDPCGGVHARLPFVAAAAASCHKQSIRKQFIFNLVLSTWLELNLVCGQSVWCNSICVMFKIRPDRPTTSFPLTPQIMWPCTPYAGKQRPADYHLASSCLYLLARVGWSINRGQRWPR